MPVHDDHCNPNPAPLYLGLMSGTSIDGIDAALVRINANPITHCELIAAQTSAWDPNLRTTLLELSQGQNTASLDQLGWLDAQVGLAFATAANHTDRKNGHKAHTDTCNWLSWPDHTPSPTRRSTLHLAIRRCPPDRRTHWNHYRRRLPTP